ncbi:MAG TPA: SpoIIE family protein phosphatase, partial [Pirellulales bacterium]
VKEDDRVMMLVVDGLGHGPHAHVAAREAIAALVEHPQAGPLEVMQFAQEKLLPTRGAAVAVAEIIPSTGKVRFVGVGNIGAFIVAGGKTQRMVSLNGVVGVPPFRGRVMDYSFARPATIVFFSDGLQTQTRMDGYEGLANNDPAVIAGVLYRDFRRSRDDATAVVVSIN